jgi:hypothetical protein
MSTTWSRLFAAGVVAGAALALASGAATPAAAAGDFGDHFSSCAQSVGFNADHNPGMHQGLHGWDPNHAC